MRISFSGDATIVAAAQWRIAKLQNDFCIRHLPDDYCLLKFPKRLFTRQISSRCEPIFFYFFSNRCRRCFRLLRKKKKSFRLWYFIEILMKLFNNNNRNIYQIIPKWLMLIIFSSYVFILGSLPFIFASGCHCSNDDTNLQRPNMKRHTHVRKKRWQSDVNRAMWSTWYVQIMDDFQ